MIGDKVLESVETPSESFHCGIASEDGETRLTVRLCRYPAMGLAWIWVHARANGRFYSAVNHDAPCGMDTTPKAPLAVYADLKRQIVFERRAREGQAPEGGVHGLIQAREGPEAREGEGPHGLSFEMAFQGSRSYRGLIEGRAEIFGKGTAKLLIDGREFSFGGPAQFHEQRQSDPRFVTPFSYATFWSAEAAMTLLLTPKGRGGYILEGAQSHDIATWDVSPPAERRTLSFLHPAQGKIEAEVIALQRYALTIYGKPWAGSMIRTQIAGRTYFGHLNDWLSPQVPYGLA